MIAAWFHQASQRFIAEYVPAWRPARRTWRMRWSASTRRAASVVARTVRVAR